MHAFKSIFPALAAGALLCLSACLSEPDLAPGEGAKDTTTIADSIRIRDSIRVKDSIHVRDSLKALPMVFAITSDYMTGAYSVLGIDSAYKKTSIAPIHSDAVVRYLGGDDIFVINRQGRDNLQIVDRHNLKTVLQFAFKPLSNPQDVELKDSLIYVAFLGTDKIGIYHESDGSARGEIDLSAYADSSDKLPETADLLFVGKDLYALTQNFDTKPKFWVPLTAHLLKINPATKQVIKALELPYGNPAGMAYDSASGRIYIPCQGVGFDETFQVVKDGGIVSVDLASFEVKDTLATESGLGGNVNAARLFDRKLIMSIGTDAADKVSAISLADGKVESIVDLDVFGTGGLAVDDKTATLFVGDRKPGAERLRFFDLATYKEKDGSKVDLGAPPSDLAIIR